MVTRNAAAEAKTGWQRAVTHKISGNSSAMGTAVVQGSAGRKITTTLMAVRAASARKPSIASFRGGGLRAAEASPITSGAIVMMPSASDANQFCQVAKIDAGAP